MEFLGDLVGIGSNVAAGGLFGLFGSVIGATAKFFQRRQEANERLADRLHELTLMRLQGELRQLETENELDIIRSEQSGRARTASYRTPITVRNVHTWVNDTRSLFRPFLTLVLDASAVGVLIYILSDIQNGALSAVLTASDPSSMLVAYMVESLFFTASTATVWWFGDRALAPPNQKNV